MTLPSNPVVLIAYGEEDNLGVGYLMSVLNQAGISTRMIDFRYDNADILEGIRRYDPIVVGFSVIYESCINEFVRLARFLRKGEQTVTSWLAVFMQACIQKNSSGSSRSLIP